MQADVDCYPRLTDSKNGWNRQQCAQYIKLHGSQPCIAALAQSAERTAFNRVVAGSSPASGDILSLFFIFHANAFLTTILIKTTHKTAGFSLHIKYTTTFHPGLTVKLERL